MTGAFFDGVMKAVGRKMAVIVDGMSEGGCYFLL